MEKWYRCSYCGKKIALIEVENDRGINGVSLFCGRCKKINKISIPKHLTYDNKKC